MKPELVKSPVKAQPAGEASVFRTVIEWLMAADREYRAAQSMVNETHDKI